MNFYEVLRHTLEFEGGYANNPYDRGGETFRGVSRKNWPAWPGWALIDQAKMHGIDSDFINDAFRQNLEMEELVTEFYHKNFWRPFDGLYITPLAKAKLFDTAVNVGTGQAVKLLQMSLNDMGMLLAVDGAVGPKTISATQNVFAQPAAESTFLNYFIKRQGDFYRNLASKKPSQAQFLKSWLRRAAWRPL